MFENYHHAFKNVKTVLHYSVLLRYTNLLFQNSVILQEMNKNLKLHYLNVIIITT